jgi:hypothetical protein
MIYLWQNPSAVLLEKLYKHNESRSEENKLTFPDDAASKTTYQYTIRHIINSLCLSNRDYYAYSNIHVFSGKNHDDEDDEDNEIDAIKKKNKQELNKNTENTSENNTILYNVFDLTLWSVSDLAAILRECDVLTRIAGREMDKSSLMTRMRQVYYNTESSSIYKPSPLGHNWRGFWSPYITDIFMTIATVIGTLAGVHYLYTNCEYYHYIWNCSNWRKMYSLECYVLKKSRSYLEEMNYNLVYTTLCGLGIALTGMLARAKAYATKNAGAEG